MSDFNSEPQLAPITSLTKKQRRVLGTLIEKALTVPDSYPLTINSLISGCNQKSNRAPLANYDETDIEDTINELRDLGLVAAVHTDGARSEKYRHYVRRRFTLTEPQIGILTELLLRGRQAVGELRARAGRLAPKNSLDTQEQLRSELQGLLDLKLVQVDGPLDRRGVEVDHNLYAAQEGQKLAYRESVEGDVAEDRPAVVARPMTAAAPSMAPPASTSGGTTDSARLRQLEADCAKLRTEQVDLRSLCDELKHQVEELTETVDRLKRDLGA